MKSLMATARNILLSVVEGKTSPIIEVVILVREPDYQFGADGEVQRDRTTETVRFVASPDGLRTMADNLHRWAAEAELIAGGKEE